jgi:hypothetical protein
LKTLKHSHGFQYDPNQPPSLMFHRDENASDPVSLLSVRHSRQAADLNQGAIETSGQNDLRHPGVPIMTFAAATARIFVDDDEACVTPARGRWKCTA